MENSIKPFKSHDAAAILAIPITFIRFPMVFCPQNDIYKQSKSFFEKSEKLNHTDMEIASIQPSTSSQSNYFPMTT